jgi:hypothetical protein
MDELIERLRRLDPVPEQLAPLPLESLLRLLDQQPDRPARAPVTPSARDRRSRWQASIGAFVTVAAVIIALVVGVGGLVLLGHDNRTAQPTAPGATPGRQQLIGMLGVLRRPQTEADIDRGLLNSITRRVHQGLPQGAPDVPLMRLVITSWGEKLYLIPMKPPSNSALRGIWQKTSGPRMPLRRFIAAHDMETLGLFTSNGGGGGNQTSANIQYLGSDAFTGRPAQRGYQYLIRVVPDDVTKVVFVVRGHLGHLEPGIPANPPPTTVTATVHNNIAAARSIRKGPGGSFEAIWYGTHDQVLKRSVWP